MRSNIRSFSIKVFILLSVFSILSCVKNKEAKVQVILLTFRTLKTLVNIRKIV